MRVTIKMQREARALMAAALDARAEKAARALRLGSRAVVDAREREAEQLGDAAATIAARRIKEPTALARALGEAWHKNNGALYKSQYAGVAYGRGGQEREEWLYAKSYKHPARWHDGGARWAISGRALLLVIETSTGAAAARIRIASGAGALTADGLTHGDAYGRKQGAGIVKRYGAGGEFIGYALQFALGRAGWEHGVTMEAINAERAHKDAILAVRRAAERETARDRRRARLFARIGTVTVTRDDARAIGACVAGIQGWLARIGQADAQALPAREVLRYARETGERQAEAAALMAARRVIAAAVEA